MAAGQSALDIGIDAIEVVQTPQGLFALTSSRAYGGLTSYALTAEGLSLRGSVLFHSGINRSAAPAIVTHALDGVLQAGVTQTDTQIVSYRVFDDGTLGSRRWVDFAPFAGDAANIPAQRALALLGDAAFPVTGAAPWQTGTIAFDYHAGGVLALGKYAPEIYSYTLAPNGTYAPAVVFGPDQGLWVHAPTAMEVVTAYGATFAIIAGAGSHSLSVVQVGAGGSLTLRDHILDTGQTRFADVQALAQVRAGDHTLIVAGGSDFGLTLFTLLPDGRLVWMQTFADSAQARLQAISSLEAVVVGGQVLVMAGSAVEAGLTVLNLPLSQLGEVRTASVGALTGTARDDLLIAQGSGQTLSGGAGHDILVAGPGATTLTGGAGSDTFVLHPDVVTANITDFERGIDRLDLSAWPMLRAPDQVQVTTTATGAVVSYRGAQVQITASNAAALTRNDLFPGGVFQTPDRLMLPQTTSGGQEGDGTPPAPPLPVLYARSADTQPDPLAGARLLAVNAQSGAVLGQVVTDDAGQFTFAAGQGGVLAPDTTLGAPRSAITGADVADILSMAFGRAPAFVAGRGLTMADLVAADVNGDGQITFRDAMMAHKIAQGLMPVPDPVLVPRAWADSPATTLPDTLPVAGLGSDAVLILRGDLDASALWAL